MALTDSAGILFKIKGDPSDALKAFKDTQGAATGLTSSFTSLVNPAALATAGIAAMATAAVAAASALFDLTKKTGEYGDAIFDVAQKTGVSTDALQAFKVAADQSGSSFEVVEKSLTKFSVTLGKSAVEGSKADKMLDKYGITARDIDGALEQAIKAISNLSTVEKQNAAAAELFTDRSGNMANAIREMKGDLPGQIKLLKELGVVMGEEDVEAAAEFTDQLAQLNTQLDGVYRTIGSDVLPIFLEFAKAVSTWLKENRSEVKFWSEGFKVSILAVVNSIRLAYNWWSGLGDMIYSTGKALYYFATRDFAKVQAVYDEWGKNQEARQKIIGSILRGETMLSGNTPTGLVGGSAAVFTDDSELDKKAVEERKAAAEKRRKEREAAAKKDLETQSTYIDLQIKAIRQFFQDTQAAAEQAYLDRLDTEDQFIEKSKKALAKYRTDTEGYLNAAFNIDVVGKNADEIQNLDLARTQAKAAIIRDIQREEKDRAKTIADMKRKDAAQETKEFEDKIEQIAIIRDAQLRAYTEERKEQEELLRIAKERAEMMADLFKDMMGDDKGPSIVGPDPFEKSLDWLKDLPMQMVEDFAKGIGSIVENLVLMGDAGPDAMRKLVASVLAGVSAQAATLAIMELAYGIAALTPWGAAVYGPAPLHFQSAALFGSIALGAGLAGRAVAGNAFSKGGGAAQSAASPSSLTQNPPPVSRSSSGAGSSGRTWEAQVVGQMLGLSQAVDGLNNKIGSMQPHEVMTRAENQRPGITASHAVNGIAANGGLGTRLQRVTGARR